MTRCVQWKQYFTTVSMNDHEMFLDIFHGQNVWIHSSTKQLLMYSQPPIIIYKLVCEICFENVWKNELWNSLFTSSAILEISEFCNHGNILYLKNCWKEWTLSPWIIFLLFPDVTSPWLMVCNSWLVTTFSTQPISSDVIIQSQRLVVYQCGIRWSVWSRLSMCRQHWQFCYTLW